MTNKKQLVVVDPAIKTPEIDCFNWIALQSPLPATYHLPALTGMDSLEAMENIAGILLLGSEGSVNDHTDWQKKLEKWLEKRWERETPTLGICYSHQLIAQMLGGRVERAPVSSLGVRQVTFDGDLFGEQVRNLNGPLFVLHNEWVSEAPQCLKEIARGPGFPHDGFRHESLPIWTVQPHPEATPSFVQVAGGNINETPLAFGHAFVKNFLQYCEGYAR